MKIQLKSPLIITVITILTFLGILKLPLELLLDNFDLSKQRIDHIDRVLKNIVIVTLAIMVIKNLRLNELAGISKHKPLQHKYLILIPFYLVLIGILSLMGTDLSGITLIDVVLLTLAMLSVGFAEEYIFRGILQSVFLKKFIHLKNGIFISIGLPALLFGLLHLVNFDPANIAASLSQVVYAFFIGTAFGAILLKTNKLFPLAIIHGLIDIVFSINTLLDQNELPGQLEQQSTADAIGSIIVVLPLFIVGLLIIRSINKATVLEKIKTT